MGGESQKKWLGVGKLQKFKCNSQVQKNLLGLFLPFSQFLYRYYKMFSRSLFSQNRMKAAGAEVACGEGIITQETPDDDALVKCKELGKTLAAV